MRIRYTLELILAIAAVLILPAVLCAQKNAGSHSYRITPPLRVAGRPVDGLAPRAVTQADPFKPREAKVGPAILAVQGYCLVSLRDQQKWTQGSPQIQAILGGKVYLFSSSRAREIFLAAPHLYLPAFDGDCLVTFAESETRISGQLECGLVYGNRVYFFADQDQLRDFQLAPTEYQDADLVDGGACIVTKIMEKKFAPGLPETVAMVDGLRYYFAAAYQRQIFRQNPTPFLVQPLRNPRAAARLEVPAFADAIVFDALSLGQQAFPMSNTLASPSNTKNRIPNIRKGGDARDTDDSREHEEFLLNRAMSGYCPVTLRTQNSWRRGKLKFRHSFDGLTYYLAGSEELAAFQANPRLYAPVLSGDSVVAMAANFERVAGNVFHAFFYKERLYLFTSEEEREVFRDAPARFEDIDLAAFGNCMVSRVDDKQEVVGMTEFETLYHGKRYRFVSTGYLQKFLANPTRYAEE